MQSKGKLLKNSESILRERAIKASKVEVGNLFDDGINLVYFMIDGQKYAIESKLVSEVYPFVLITKVPHTPSYIEGIVHIRGRFVSVVNINNFFGMSKVNNEQSKLFLLLRNEEVEFAIGVDAVLEQSVISQKQLQQIPPDFDFLRADLLLGVSEDGVIVFNGEKLVADSAMMIQT